MAVEWEISENTHGRIVTCQRPILIGLSTDTITVDHFRVMLEIKDQDETDEGIIIDENWSWVDTGIRINAYSDDGGEYYQINLSPYVRDYFVLSEDWLTQRIIPTYGEQTDWNHMWRREFRARVWPVVFGEDGGLIEESGNFKYISEFMVFDTNIKEDEQTSVIRMDNIRMDDFVTGNCDGSEESNTRGNTGYKSEKFNKLLTNMPGATRAGETTSERLQIYNVLDGVYPRVGIGYNMLDTIRYRFDYTVTRADGTEDNYYYYSGYGSPYPWTDTNNCDILWYETDLRYVDLVLNFADIADYAMFDVSGNLNCTKVVIKSSFYTAAGLIRTGPSFAMLLTDKDDDGKCNKTRFVFKNSRGGMDWFSCYGQEEKEVSVIGTTYTTQQEVKRSGLRFNQKPGQHSTSNIWNTRQEKYKLITQPVSPVWAEWLEEMMSSPMVWVEELDKGWESGDDGYEYLNTSRWRSCQRLIPVIIDKGSITVYNTEDNMQYIEFSYTKSNQNTTSKAY
tara:strand:- start:14261 stop:15781 length:1521 start_codon:yes stop_codon:yes gene_type:complete